MIAALAAAAAGADLLIYGLHVVGQLDGDDSSVEYALHHAAKRALANDLVREPQLLTAHLPHAARGHQRCRWRVGRSCRSIATGFS